jgi:hypothetical protein
MERRPANTQHHGQRSHEREREQRDVQTERPAMEDEITEDAEPDRRSEKSKA